MNITINGQTKDISGTSQTVGSLVAQFCKEKKHVIAELNGSIIPSSDWDKTGIKEADAIELVSFVGGG